jgi:hypothetical protein
MRDIKYGRITVCSILVAVLLSCVAKTVFADSTVTKKRTVTRTQTIEDSEVPLARVPVEIIDEDVPLARFTRRPVIIDENEVPLALRARRPIISIEDENTPLAFVRKYRQPRIWESQRWSYTIHPNAEKTIAEHPEYTYKLELVPDEPQLVRGLFRDRIVLPNAQPRIKFKVEK